MTDNSQRPIIYWFRNDLRLTDNCGLSAAVKSGCPVIAVFILDPSQGEQSRLGQSNRWWLHYSLQALQESLAEAGGMLVLRSGEPVAMLSELIADVGARGLYFSRMYEPEAREQEQTLHQLLADQLEVKRFAGSLLFEPEAVSTARGSPVKIFTPFWKACLKLPPPSQVLPAPEKFPLFNGQLRTERLEDWNLISDQSARNLGDYWQPGEAGAEKSLNKFLASVLKGYKTNRDFPAFFGTSRLSAHLHFGEISPRQVWISVKQAQAELLHLDNDAESFLREIGWREFCTHLLFHWPDLPINPFRKEFIDFPWEWNGQQLAAWQQGNTGFPIVDAGMRELLQSGWMHNRVRMIAASFLVKDLLQPWQEGEAWFREYLVDADLANNVAGWQWVVGCGADAAPYFRVFNPMLQGKKFDPEGEYVKRWIPELAEVPAQFIHEPWAAPAEILQQAGVELGTDYPFPIVDHALARNRALQCLQVMKNLQAEKGFYKQQSA